MVATKWPKIQLYHSRSCFGGRLFKLQDLRIFICQLSYFTKFKNTHIEKAHVFGFAHCGRPACSNLNIHKTNASLVAYYMFHVLRASVSECLSVVAWIFWLYSIVVALLGHSSCLVVLHKIVV